MKPVLKWAGGKTKLLPELLARFPAAYNRFYEPFVGGGAVFFRLAPDRAVLGDLNADLVNVYEMVRDEVDDVAEWLEAHARSHDEEHFRNVRTLWNAGRYRGSGRAAAFIYLNRTCYNGLWRVNAAGEFNVPMGRYANPRILDRDNLLAASAALQHAELRCADYRETVADAEAGDLVYFDPPYDGTWTDYTADGFGEQQHRELAETARDLVARGIYVVLSNSDTPLTRALYSDFDVQRVSCARAVNSDPDKRGPVDELIVVGRKRTMTRQTTIAGTEPIEQYPEIRTKLDTWLKAKEDEKDAKERSKRYHDELLDAIQAAKLPYYTYDADGKRKRVYPTVGDPKLKTETVGPTPGEEKRGRRGRAKDVELPIDKERAKAVDAIEHRKVSRTEIESDPFAVTRTVMNGGAA